MGRKMKPKKFKTFHEKKACPEISSHNIKWNFSSLNKRNHF